MDDLHLLHEHGVFLRRDAIAAGYDDKLLYGELRAGTLQRVRYGAYIDRQTWLAASDRRRQVLRGHAVALTHQEPFALSHTTGALLHGLDLWGVDLTPAHVTRPGPANGLRSTDVTYHVGAVDEPELVEGTPVVSAVRSALGLGLISSIEAGVVAIDSAYARGADRDLVAAEYDRVRTWSGAARLRITVRIAQPGSGSVGESRIRVLFFRYGIPKPVLQFPVHDDGELVGKVDFAWPDRKLLGEFDGRMKYDQLVRPGETPADVVFREKVREDRLREVTGWKMIRFTWADLSRPDATAHRLRRALLA